MIDSVLAQGDVAWVALDREVVVHHAADRTGYVLDPMAAALWQCLDGESTLGEVLADLAEVTGAPLAQVVSDCLPVVESWVAAGIAVVVDDGPTHEQPVLRTWRRLVAPPNG
jgi:hypothetical protein